MVDWNRLTSDEPVPAALLPDSAAPTATPVVPCSALASTVTWPAETLDEPISVVSIFAVVVRFIVLMTSTMVPAAP